jgi:hypothetical protein
LNRERHRAWTLARLQRAEIGGASPRSTYDQTLDFGDVLRRLSFGTIRPC